MNDCFENYSDMYAFSHPVHDQKAMKCGNQYSFQPIGSNQVQYSQCSTIQSTFALSDENRTNVSSCLFSQLHLSSLFTYFLAKKYISNKCNFLLAKKILFINIWRLTPKLSK